MGVVKVHSHTIGLVSYLICFLFVSHQSDHNTWDTAISKFDLQKSKINVMGEVKGQDHIVDPESNNAPSFRSTSSDQSFPEICPIVFDLAKTQLQFWKKN